MSAGLLSVSVDRAFIQILRAAKHADDIRVGPKSLGAEPTARIRLNLPIRTRNNRSLGELSSVETSLQLFSNVAQIGSHVVFSSPLSLSPSRGNAQMRKSKNAPGRDLEGSSPSTNLARRHVIACSARLSSHDDKQMHVFSVWNNLGTRKRTEIGQTKEQRGIVGGQRTPALFIHIWTRAQGYFRRRGSLRFPFSSHPAKFSLSSRVDRDAAALINHERAPSFLESIPRADYDHPRCGSEAPRLTINLDLLPPPPAPRNKRNARAELG